MQEILALLQQMGLMQPGQGWQGAGDISSQSIANQLASQFGIEGQHLPSSLFSPISGTSMQNLLGKTYSPYMESAAQPLLSDLMVTSGGEKARKAAGGFAGTGGFSQFQQQAKDVYGKGMTQTLSGIGESRATQQASIMDLIDQWRQTASSIRYG